MRPVKAGQQKRVYENVFFGGVSKTFFYSNDLRSTLNRVCKNRFSGWRLRNGFLLDGFVWAFAKGQVRGPQKGRSWGFWENWTAAKGIL